MQTLRKTIHILLVMAILSAGLPLHHPADANRDDTVGLEDAILRMRDLVQGAEKQESLAGGMENVRAVLSVVAGFEKVVSSGHDASRDQTSFLDLPYLISASEFAAPQPEAALSSDSNPGCRSVILSPEHRPPRFV